MAEEGYKFYGIGGKINLFAVPHCETDRWWRKALAITPERYVRNEEVQFDECNNAFMKPKKPTQTDLLDHLHKFADYE